MMQIRSQSQEVLAALDFAFKAHEGQYRKNRAQTSMRQHITEVVYYAEMAGSTDAEIIGAAIHDIFEDTDKTVEEVERVCGPEATAIALDLTDPPEHKKYFDIGIFVGKIEQATRIASKAESSRKVKLCDLISNVQCVGADPILRWGKDQCLEYTEGARVVAGACRGISRILDKEFDRVYPQAMASYELRWPAVK